MYVILHSAAGLYLSYVDSKRFELTDLLSLAIYFDSREYAYAFIEHFDLDLNLFEVRYVEPVSYGYIVAGAY